MESSCIRHANYKNLTYHINKSQKHHLQVLNDNGIKYKQKMESYGICIITGKLHAILKILTTDGSANSRSYKHKK